MYRDTPVKFFTILKDLTFGTLTQDCHYFQRNPQTAWSWRAGRWKRDCGWWIKRQNWLCKIMVDDDIFYNNVLPFILLLFTINKELLKCKGSLYLNQQENVCFCYFWNKCSGATSRTGNSCKLLCKSHVCKW